MLQVYISNAHVTILMMNGAASYVLAKASEAEMVVAMMVVMAVFLLFYCWCSHFVSLILLWSLCCGCGGGTEYRV